MFVEKLRIMDFVERALSDRRFGCVSFNRTAPPVRRGAGDRRRSDDCRYWKLFSREEHSSILIMPVG